MHTQSTKSYEIDKHLIWSAYQKVRENRGAAGIDGIGLEEYRESRASYLYKLWNRMSSGSYFPKPVRLVEIPKSGGGKRPLGIPTVEDRIAQMAVVIQIEPLLDPLFHQDSYGYRPGRSAHDAIGIAKQRCWKYDWVLDMDISKFFDTIDHEKLMKAVEKHISTPWVLLYIRRWLKVPYELSTGERIERTMGVAQGSVIGPILANLFLHYALDKWLSLYHPLIAFERYADDCLCHCRSREEAQNLKGLISERLKSCGLKLNEEKTYIVCCNHSIVSKEDSFIGFDFLGFTFRPRKAMRKDGGFFTGFMPAISQKSKNRIREVIRGWNLNRLIPLRLEDIAERIEPAVRGWISYYGKFYKSSLNSFLQEVNFCIARWLSRKYKRFRGKYWQALYWLGRVARRDKSLFYHWRCGIVPVTS